MLVSHAWCGRVRSDDPDDVGLFAWAESQYTLSLVGRLVPLILMILVASYYRCAEELTFNGYSLATKSTRPVRLQAGESKRFFSVQFNGEPACSL